MTEQQDIDFPIVDLFDFFLFQDEEFEEEERQLWEENREVYRLSREVHAQIGARLKKARIWAELATNEKVVTVHPPISSIDDFIRIIPEQRQSCIKIASIYANGDSDAAEDIYQDALVKAYSNLKSGGPFLISRAVVKQIQLDGGQAVNPKARQLTVKNPVAWLHTIVRNTGLNECSHRKKAKDALRRLGEHLERESRRFELPEATALHNISNAELHDYVNCLPERFSKIINLHFFGGFSYEEIAKELNCRPGTVRTSAKRALAMLKDVLQGKRDVRGGRIGRPKASLVDHRLRQTIGKHAG